MTDIQEEFDEIRMELGGDGVNTLIEYGYADGGNFKTHSHVVLAGRISPEQIRNILTARSDSEFFIPSQVGMRDLQGDFEHGSEWDDEVDHVWHRVETIAYTDATAGGTSVEALVVSWPKDAKDWDLVAAMERIEGTGYHP